MYHGVDSSGGSAAGEDNVEVVPAVFFFLRGPSVGPLTVFLVFFLKFLIIAQALILTRAKFNHSFNLYNSPFFFKLYNINSCI